MDGRTLPSLHPGYLSLPDLQRGRHDVDGNLARQLRIFVRAGWLGDQLRRQITQDRLNRTEGTVLRQISPAVVAESVGIMPKARASNTTTAAEEQRPDETQSDEFYDVRNTLDAISEAEWPVSARLDGAPARQGLRINDYVSVIQPVMEGQGVALGWAHLIDRLVGAGSLVRLTDHIHRTGKSFNVSWPRNQDITGNVALVRDWLADQLTT